MEKDSNTALGTDEGEKKRIGGKSPIPAHRMYQLNGFRKSTPPQNRQRILNE
jgi:hypothetical protein